jgi:predicted RNase H-like HicB family nuclease
MTYTLECEMEADDRWLAELVELPGVMAYGKTREDALLKTQALALRVIAEQLEHGEAKPVAFSISLPEAA